MTNKQRNNYQSTQYNTTDMISNHSTIDDLHTVNKIQWLYCDDLMEIELYDTYIQIQYVDKLRHIDIKQRYDKSAHALIY